MIRTAIFVLLMAALARSAGGATEPAPAVQPAHLWLIVDTSPQWVAGIIDACRRASLPVFLKNNLQWPERIQEWPKLANCEKLICCAGPSRSCRSPDEERRPQGRHLA